MKKWSVCLLLVLILLAGAGRSAEGAQIPLELQLYEQDNQEVLVRLVATEPLVLNAFTLEIQYDMETYKLHKWNDEVPDGYGYSGEFRQQYEKGGLALGSETPGTVVLSGMNSGETAAIPAGAFAQVSLLRYQDGVGDGEISLHITALNINGESISLTEDETRVTGEEMPEKAPVLSMDKPEDIAESEDTGSGNVQSMLEDAGMTDSSAQEPADGEVSSSTQGAEDGEESLQDDSAESPADNGNASLDGSYNTEGQADYQTGLSNDNKQDKEGQTFGYVIWLGAGAAVILLIVGAAIFLIWRRKNHSAHSQPRR